MAIPDTQRDGWNRVTPVWLTFVCKAKNNGFKIERNLIYLFMRWLFPAIAPIPFQEGLVLDRVSLNIANSFFGQ